MFETKAVRYNQQTLSNEEQAQVRQQVGAQEAKSNCDVVPTNLIEKLDNIPASAQENVIETIKIGAETLRPSEKTVTIPMASYTPASGQDPEALADGAMSGSDKKKLAGIASGAQVNVIEAITVDGNPQSASQKTVDIPKYTGSDAGVVPPRDSGDTTTKFLREDGTWQVPAGGGGGGGSVNSVSMNNGSSITPDGSGNVNLPLATNEAGSSPTDGIMSAADKVRLDSYPDLPQSPAGHFLKDDGTWDEPTDTTYSTFTSAADGLVPKSSSSGDTGKFLKGDGTWATPQDTTYSKFTSAADGLVPKSSGSGDADKFLKGDGTWATPQDTTYSTFSESADGLVPKSSGSGDTGKFLKGDGSWATPQDTTYSTFTSAADGLVPKSSGSGDTGKFLKGDGSWATPQDTTYSAYAGSDAGLVPQRDSGSTTTTKFLREDGTWQVPAGGGGGGSVDSVSMAGGTPITPDANGNVDLPAAASASGNTPATAGIMSATDKARLDRSVDFVDNQASDPAMIAERTVVVTGDQQIIDFVNGGHCDGKGTVFFVVQGV